MPPQNNTQKSWEEEFDEKWDFYEIYNDASKASEDIKLFISELLSKQAEEISEAVEAVFKDADEREDSVQLSDTLLAIKQVINK